MSSYFGEVTQSALCFRRKKKTTTVTLAGRLNTFLIVLQPQQSLAAGCVCTPLCVSSKAKR